MAKAHDIASLRWSCFLLQVVEGEHRAIRPSNIDGQIHTSL